VIRCEKWHGAGNDFLVAAEIDGRPPEGWSAWAKRACDRHVGVGADGLLVLQGDGGPRMGYWNADGSEAEMCGNGGRVLAAYLSARTEGRPDTVRFRSAWGDHQARVAQESEHRYRVEITLPDLPPASPISVPAPWGPGTVLFVMAGVPHLVVRRSETPAESLAAVPVEAWGRELRRLPLPGGAGANVDFLEVEDGSLRLRTYERGVEGETLACGTGALAAAAAAVAWEIGAPPYQVTPWSGDTLQVSLKVAPAALVSVRLSGPAVRIARVDVENS
jgi:diaminopimelate epimerase